jgi:hypothetical protein
MTLLPISSEFSNDFGKYSTIFFCVSIYKHILVPMFKLTSSHTCMNCAYLRENSEIRVVANCEWCNTAF